MNLHSEKHDFLEINGDNLYCSFYSPLEKTPDEIIILCKPIWGERIRTHRIYKNLGIMLAEKGFIVVTFDYYADGNSAGLTRELEFDKMVSNVIEVAQFMQTTYNVEKISLFGLRLGATVSLFANGKSNFFNKVLAFEPILDLEKHAYEGLRINIAMQMTRYKKILNDRRELLKKLDSGELISLDGFIIDRRFYYSFANKEIDKNLIQKSNVFLGAFEKSKVLRDLKKIVTNPENTPITLLPKEFDWTAWKNYVKRPGNLFRWVEDTILKQKVEVFKND